MRQRSILKGGLPIKGVGDVNSLSLSLSLCHSFHVEMAESIHSETSSVTRSAATGNTSLSAQLWAAEIRQLGVVDVTYDDVWVDRVQPWSVASDRPSHIFGVDADLYDQVKGTIGNGEVSGWTRCQSTHQVRLARSLADYARIRDQYPSTMPLPVFAPSRRHVCRVSRHHLASYGSSPIFDMRSHASDICVDSTPRSRSGRVTWRA